MRITIDTEKDSREDILATISLLKKIIGEETYDSPAILEKPVKSFDEEQKNAEEILRAMVKPKKESTPEAEVIPKSVKEAYELTDELETY